MNTWRSHKAKAAWSQAWDAPIVLAGSVTMLSDYMNGKGVEFRVALATGIAAAMRVKGRSDVRVVAQGGDGSLTEKGTTG